MRFIAILSMTLLLTSCGALKLASGLLGSSGTDKSIAKGAQVRLGGTHTDSKTVSLGSSIKSTGNKGVQSARDSVTYQGSIDKVNNKYGLEWWLLLIIALLVPDVRQWFVWAKSLFRKGEK